MTDITEVITRLTTEGPDDRLRLAATWLTEHPDLVATLSKREVAKRAGVTIDDLERLAARLSLIGYADLRAIYRREMSNSPEGTWYSSGVILKGGETKTNKPAREWLNEVFVSSMDNLEESFAANSESIVTAANLILDAENENIHILGWRSCFSVAYLLNYTYRMFRGNGRLVTDPGEAGEDELRWLKPGDVLIAISVEPYTAEIIRATQYALERGARIIAITDNEQSPLARLAAVALYAENVTPSFFHSMAALVSLVEALASLVFILAGPEGLRGIEHSENHLSYFKPYLSPTDPTERSSKQRGT